jgi:hypothetical protein
MGAAGLAQKYRKKIASFVGLDSADAIQHVLWMAVVSLMSDTKEALALGRAHEQDTRQAFNSRNKDLARDLANNKIGAAIGAEARHNGEGIGWIVQTIWVYFWTGKLRCEYVAACYRGAK